MPAVKPTRKVRLHVQRDALHTIKSQLLRDTRR